MLYLKYMAFSAVGITIIGTLWTPQSVPIYLFCRVNLKQIHTNLCFSFLLLVDCTRYIPR